MCLYSTTQNHAFLLKSAPNSWTTLDVESIPQNNFFPTSDKFSNASGDQD